MSDSTPAQLLAGVVRSRALRRLVVVQATFVSAEMGSWIAITTVAHGFGGVGEAAAVLVAQLAPAALFALAVGSLAQRWGQRTVFRTGLLVQSLAFATIAVLLAIPSPPRIAVYAVAVLAAMAVTTTRPMVAAVLPGAVDDPRQLTAANAALGWVEGTATLVGPAITAVCIAVVDPWLAFAVFAALTAIAAVATAGVRATDAIETVEEERVALVEASRAVRRDSGVRSVLAASAACSFAVGCLDLLYVVLAVDVLHGHEADASWLNTAFGIGALVGGSVAFALAGGHRLWKRVVIAGAAFAVALAALGIGHHRAVAALLFAACGIAQAVLMVSVRTLLQRVTELRLLCHVFALSEASHTAMLLLGAVLVPAFVALFGARWAGVGVAALVVLAITPGVRAMARADGRAEAWLARIPTLRATAVFSLLPAPALETLARQAQPCRFEPGARIVTEGDEGDRFFVIAGGTVAVTRAGAHIATRGRGDGIGELALLHDVPRSATVTAVDAVETLAVDRTTFLVAVTGHAPTLQHATTEVRKRYADLR